MTSPILSFQLRAKIQKGHLPNYANLPTSPSCVEGTVGNPDKMRLQFNHTAEVHVCRSAHLGAKIPPEQKRAQVFVDI